MAESNDAPVRYRHQVIQKWAPSFSTDENSWLSEDSAKTLLDEFVIEWEEAEQAPTCEHCGEPVEDGDGEVDEHGELAHGECLRELDHDIRDDENYWRD